MAQDCAMTLAGEDAHHPTNCRYMDKLGLCFAYEDAQVCSFPGGHFKHYVTSLSRCLTLVNILVLFDVSKLKRF
jgi:hypothetical protein